MKNVTMSLMIAAAVVGAAGSAWAQNYNARIPMAFSVGDKQMTPGSYRIFVENSNGVPMVTLHNTATKSSAILVTRSRSDTPKAWLQQGKPVIAFDCLDGNCALRKLWNGSDSSIYQFP
ncbi:MAG TPA: hypothetical protein VGS58_11030, partial [Candidatus Sulfopaludibacter sp.]|nr:hypothetical protein [Candidatus Sulfopaludibacter sp.]